MRAKAEKPLPWERQPDESAKAYEAFVTYRDMGEERTITAVVKKCEKSRSLIDRWKKLWDWEKRVLAYDNELQKEDLKKAKKERREMNRRHADLSLRLQKAALTALENKDFSEMTDRDIVSFVRLAAELERTARADDAAALEQETEDYEETAGEAVTVQIYLPDNGRMG